ncbi:MAG: ABC transporter permease [Acetobacteraceae bacterium]|nr:ABC transporter permease [Acetobacteraceae bacterium]
MSCHTSAFFGMGTVLRTERFFGTLPLIVASPTSRFFICAGRRLFYVLDGWLTALVALLAGSLAFGLSFSHANLIGLLACGLAGTASATCCGLFLGAYGLKATDVNLIMNLATYSLLVLAGVNFPVESLPGPLQAVSRALPLTRAVAGARLAYAGGSWVELAPLLAMELATGAAYLALGYVWFRILERRARHEGAFDFY